MGSVLEAFNIIKTLIEREENKEKLALCGGVKYMLLHEYKYWYATKCNVPGFQKGGKDT